MKQSEGSKQNLAVKNRVNKFSCLFLKLSNKKQLFFKENQEDLMDLIHEREILEEKLLDYEQINRNLINKQKQLTINHESIINNINKQYKRIEIHR